MSTPALSVLLPVWDAEATLQTSLRSIARQSEADFECLLVDDGSRDRSCEIARDWQARDRRFHVIERPHEGIVAALNAGLERCRGEFVARVDADDCLHRHRFRLQREALDADPGLDAVGCHVRLFPRSNLAAGMRAYESWLLAIRGAGDVARDVFVECPLAHPTWLVRRALFAELPYRDRGWPEDYDWLLRAHRRGKRLGVVPRRLVSWRNGSERLSRRDPRYGIERFVACKAHHLARGFLADSDHYVLWGYGETGRNLHRALAAEGLRASHIVELHPGRLGQTIHGAAVIEPAALAGLADSPLVVSVAGPGPRRQIRDRLAELGRLDGRDFVCAA